MTIYTPEQQTGRTTYLAVTFMIMFTAYNSLQNIISKIYNDYGYKNLGTTSVLLLYFVFGAFTFVGPFFIRGLGYKKAMFFSSLGYVVFEGAGLIIVLWTSIPHLYGWVFVMIGAAFCGAATSVIWVAQGSYVSDLAGQQNRTKLFALFWGIMMCSQIFGSILTTFVLGLIGTEVYFIVLSLLGFASAFLFLLLPDIQQAKMKDLSIKNESLKIIALIKNRQYSCLTLYYYFPGVSTGFYTTFLYKLVGHALPQRNGQSNHDYEQFLNYRTGLVLLSLGAAQVMVGIVMNQFGQKFCKFKSSIGGTVFVQLAGIASLLCFFLKSYPLCFVIAALWGGSDTFLHINLGAIVSALFPGRVESFSVYRIFNAIGVVTTIVLNLSLTSVDYWVFLLLVTVLAMVYTMVAVNVMELKNKVGIAEVPRDEEQVQ